MNSILPARIRNWIGGSERDPAGGRWYPKISPATGDALFEAARSGADDVEAAVSAAGAAFEEWARMPAVKRGAVLWAAAARMIQEREKIAEVVALETGKGRANALGETDGAIQLAQFYAGEGQRLYGRTTTSGVAGKMALTVRAPVGIAGLVVPANTPIANVAWKVFPALICGNAVVLKSADDTPATAWLFVKILQEAGVPPGLVNLVHGTGSEAGEPLVRHPRVGVVSFTGSTAVGKRIAALCAERLAKVSLELGGKNPFVVCDDADLELAKKWALLSAFSNAGQRCAAGSRILVMDAVYDRFVPALVEGAKNLKLGRNDGDDLGPVISEKQLTEMLRQLGAVKARGARFLCGGQRAGGALARGFYLEPTLIEGVSHDDEISRTELFGPIACLYRVKSFAEAVKLANDSPYGLTAAIHTRDVNRALSFTQELRSGVVSVNAGTFGSEPHMPFGGVKASGNGTREPGTEALDIYSDLKDVYLNFSNG